MTHTIKYIKEAFISEMFLKDNVEPLVKKWDKQNTLIVVKANAELFDLSRLQTFYNFRKVTFCYDELLLPEQPRIIVLSLDNFSILAEVRCELK